MPGVKFAITPDQLNAFQADQWAQPHMEALADDWQQQQLAKANADYAPPPVAPTPSDSLTNPLGTGNAGPSALLPSASPSPAPDVSAPAPSPLPAPDAPPTMDFGGAAPSPSPAPLPAPSAPPPADFGPVPSVSPNRPLTATTTPVTPLPTSAPSAGGDLVSYARQAAQKAGIDPDLFVSQINQESGFDPTQVSPAGARGIAQIVPRWHPGVNPDNPTEALDYAANLMGNLIKQYGDVRTALVAYNGGQGAVNALNAGTPYQESKDYVSKIFGGIGGGSTARSIGGGAGDVSAAGAGSPSALSLSQFNQQGLTFDEALAACGPAAAQRLAAEYGNQIPLSAALAAAKQVGWTPNGGMNGIANEKKLMDALGLPAELDTSGDWQKIISAAGNGQLVTISTPGHYFQANSARMRADGQVELYVGQSGKDLKAGKEWMTPSEIQSLEGQINGALFSDPSKAVMAGDWYQAQAQNHGFDPTPAAPIINDLSTAAQKAGVAPTATPQPSGPDETVSNPFGEAFRQIGAVKDQITSQIQSPNSGNPVVDTLGTGASALGTGVHAASDALRNITPTSELARGATGMEQIVTENRALFDQQQRLVDEFAGAQQRGDQAAMDRISTEMDTLQAQLPDARNRDVLHAAADRNPSTGLIETGANLAGAAIAAPLAAEGAPALAQGLAAAVDPATGVPAIAGRAFESATPLLRARQRGEGINPFSPPPIDRAQLSQTARRALDLNSGDAQAALAQVERAASAVPGDSELEQALTELRALPTAESVAAVSPSTASPRLSLEEQLSTHQALGQQWEELDNQAANLEAQAAQAFNPGLRARLNNEAGRIRAQQDDVMQRADYLLEHGTTPSEQVADLPMDKPAAVSTATVRARQRGEGINPFDAAPPRDAPPPPSAPTQSANPLIQRTGQMLEAKPQAAPTDSLVTRIARAWTNRYVNLDQFQEESARLAGVDPTKLPGDADAQALVRLSSDPAAEIRIQQELKPAVRAVGDDTPWLSTYLMHANNVDVAKILGERVTSEAVDAIPSANAAMQNAAARLRGRQQFLDRLTADASTPPERIRQAQNTVNSAQRSFDTAQQKFEGVRQGQLTAASQAGIAVAQNRKFPGGFTAADSAQVLADLPTELGPQRYAKVQQAAAQVQDFVKGIRERMVDSGLIDQATATKWEQQYPNWVPTRILDYLDETGAGGGPPRKLSLGDAGVKSYTIEGTQKFAEDPLGSLVGLARSVETRARKNEVVNALVNLDQMRPQGSRVLVKTDRPAAALETVVQRIDNGKVERYIAPPELAAVINGPTITQAPGYVRAFTNFQRAVTTVLSPAFALVRNPSLDVPEYITRELARSGGNPLALPQIVGDLVKGYAEAFKGLPQGEFRGDTARFMQAGGGDSGMVTRTVADRAAAVQALSRGSAIEIKNIGDVQRVLSDVLHLRPVAALAQRTEYGPRTASFIRAERAGATAPRAALAGRTVTLDFNEGGTLAKTINSFVPFFNVGFQGSAQLPRMIRENPAGTASSLALTVGLPATAATLWNRADPQRSQDYEDVPQYLKDQGIVLMLPGDAPADAKGNRKPQFLWLNMRGFAPISTLSRDIAERGLQAVGNGNAKPEDAQQLLNSIFWTSIPTRANTLGDVPGSVASANFPLPGGGTALQLALNKDIFRGSDIVSKYADQNAPQGAKELAGTLTSVAQAFNPNAEIHPSQVNFAIRELLGGVGSTALGAREMLPGGQRVDVTPQGMPVVGGALRALGVRGDTGATLTEALDQPIPQNIERVLRDAGISTPSIPTSISIRSQITNSNSPPIELRQAERARYQQLFSQRLGERLATVINSPAWAQRPIESRNKYLDGQVKAAREYAENEIYRSMAPADRQARMAVGREAAKVKPKP